MPETVWPPQVVILGGGLGTRIREKAGDLPKSLVPVLGQPFVHHQLRLLASQAIEEIVYVIGFGGPRIRAAVGDGRAFGLSVTYVDEGEELHGTGGALRYAYDAGALADVFAVTYGDSFLPIDLRPVWERFTSARCAALMTVLRNEDLWGRSNAVLERGLVVSYDKDPKHRDERMAWIDYGLTIMRRSLVAEVPPGTMRDLGELYESLASRGELDGYEVRPRFFEVGSPEGVADLEQELARTLTSGK